MHKVNLNILMPVTYVLIPLSYITKSGITQRIQAYVILVGTTKQFYKAIVPTYTPIISV